MEEAVAVLNEGSISADKAETCADYLPYAHWTVLVWYTFSS